VAVDLLDEDAPARIREHVQSSATAGWICSSTTRARPGARRFADGGYENVRRTMAINFDAQVRLTEALLPLLRASAPERDRERVLHRRPGGARGTGAYSASKFALAGWSDSLWAEERASTACTWASCCPGSSPPRASPRPS
jgi:NAD(P)-dependent dehydrogenase (short-subunit alcohol dehydrogenase family)